MSLQSSYPRRSLLVAITSIIGVLVLWVPHVGAASWLTMAKYEAIREGMSYEEVVKIIGRKGQESSRSSMAGQTSVIYTWKTWTGSNVIVQFLNDRVVTKAQAGLR
jgi:uncharacterized protein DUF3862